MQSLPFGLPDRTVLFWLQTGSCSFVFMLRLRWRLLHASLLLLTTAWSQAGAVREIVAFGDSITDSCQFGAKYVVDKALNSTKDHPGKPYYQGCFYSNGPTYALVAAEQLHISLTNYAVGGATAGFVLASATLAAHFGNNTEKASVPLPTITQQARSYIQAQKGSVPSDALYIVHIGANDYVDTVNHDYNRTASVAGVLNHTAAAMDLLYDAGARWFLTQTQPLWGESPYLQRKGPQKMADGNDLSRKHNKALRPFLEDFAVDHTEASVIMFDYATWREKLVANAAANGFINTTAACDRGGEGMCDNPEGHMFWDGLHFTGHVHRLWGVAIAAQIQPFVVPEASTATSQKLMRRLTRHTVTGNVVYGRPMYKYT